MKRWLGKSGCAGFLYTTASAAGAYSRNQAAKAPRQFLSEKCWKGSRVSHEGLGLVPGAVIWRRSLGRIPGCGAAPAQEVVECWGSAGQRNSTARPPPRWEIEHYESNVPSLPGKFLARRSSGTRVKFVAARY